MGIGMPSIHQRFLVALVGLVVHRKPNIAPETVECWSASRLPKNGPGFLTLWSMIKRFGGERLARPLASIKIVQLLITKSQTEGGTGKLVSRWDTHQLGGLGNQTTGPQVKTSHILEARVL